MTRRMIDSSMWENEKFGSMPMGAQLLQIAMINHADDQGRIKAHPVFLSKTAFPYSEEVSTGNVRDWLTILHNNGTIILYEADGKQYAQMVNWWKYQSLQYAQPSEYPRPSGWQDRIRRTLTKGVIVTCNWLKINGETIPDTCDQDGNPLPKSGGNNPPKSQPVTPEPSPNGYYAQHTNAPESTDDQLTDSGADSPNHSPESAGEDTTYSFNENVNENEKVVVVVNNTPAREAVPEYRKPATTTAEPPVPVPKEIQFVREYERVWCLMPSQYHTEKIADWAERVTFEGWTYALQECANTRNVGKWKYFESILGRVEVEGIGKPLASAAAKVPVNGNVNIGLAAV